MLSARSYSSEVEEDNTESDSEFQQSSKASNFHDIIQKHLQAGISDEIGTLIVDINIASDYTLLL
jgi:hypothetical protein